MEAPASARVNLLNSLSVIVDCVVDQLDDTHAGQKSAIERIVSLAAEEMTRHSDVIPTIQASHDFGCFKTPWELRPCVTPWDLVGPLLGPHLAKCFLSPQKPCSAVLVKLSEKFVNRVMDALTAKFQPGVSAHYYVVLTLSR